MKSGYGDPNGLYLSDMKQTGGGLRLSGETNNSNTVTRIGGSLYSKQWDNSYKGMHVPNGHGSLFNAMDQDARIIAQCNANLEKYYLKPNVQKEPVLLPLPPVQNIMEPLQLIPVQNIIEQPEQILEEEEDLLAMIQKLKASLEQEQNKNIQKDIQLKEKDATIKEKDATIENMAEKNSYLTQEIKHKDILLDRSEEKIHDLSDRLKNSEKSNNNLEIDKTDLRKNIFSLEKIIENKEEKIDEVKNSLHEKEVQYDALKILYDDIIGIGANQNEQSISEIGVDNTFKSDSYEKFEYLGGV